MNKCQLFLYIVSIRHLYFDIVDMWITITFPLLILLTIFINTQSINSLFHISYQHFVEKLISLFNALYIRLKCVEYLFITLINSVLIELVNISVEKY